MLRTQEDKRGMYFLTQNLHCKRERERERERDRLIREYRMKKNVKNKKRLEMGGVKKREET